MANPIYMGSEKYKIAKALEVGQELFIPILDNIVDPPSDPLLPATGQYQGNNYTWNVVAQQWELTGNGVDATNWTPGNSFSS